MEAGRAERIVLVADRRGEVPLVLLQGDEESVRPELLHPAHPLPKVPRHLATQLGHSQSREDLRPVVGAVDLQGDLGEVPLQREREVVGLLKGVRQDLLEFVAEHWLHTQ